ncbi:hypothetical protein ACHAWC_011496 [Mediolabrus comicus]
MLLSRTLRRTTLTAALQHQQRSSHRPLVTSAQKRALNKNQLEGAKETASSSAETTASSGGGTAAAEGGAAASSSSTTGGSSGGGGGGGGLLKFGLILGGGTAAAAIGMPYYNGKSLQDTVMDAYWNGSGGSKKKERDGGITEGVKQIMEERKKTTKKEEGTAVAPATPEPVETAAATTTTTDSSEKQQHQEEHQEEEEVSLEHPENGNRVDIDKINTFYQSVNDGHAKQQQEEEEELAQQQLDEAQEAATKATQYNESNETTTDPTVALTTAAAAMSELQSNAALQNSKTLASANAALRSDLDREYFADLDQLSQSELRTRVVQLATEMSDRTKWEAVRLKEFLSMKEKEVGDKYLEILQKQRLEFESLLAQKLREQEDTITRQANAALQAKEDSIANLLRATSEAREKETQDILSNETKRIADELELEYSTKLQNELAKMKQAYASDLEKHGSVMEMLQGKLEMLSSRLEVSQNYESGSKRAHRVSAAALALASKLEVGEGAAVEIAALKGAAGGEGVIASAVKMIPPTANKGVPTVAELQSKFDTSYAVGRQAVMVPEGRAGLEGQLLGMLFAKLSVPPSPESVPTSDEEGNVADGVLSMAKKYVQMGDLERAVEQLNKLKGQAAYVMNDWKSQAADRVSTERALKVIKLECALLNKELV